MGILSAISQVIYSFIVWSGVMNQVVDFVNSLHMFKLISFLNTPMHNHQVVDASGHTIRTLKLNDKVVPPFGEKRFRTICDIKIRPDDVMICGYPKTGCHWMFEILYMLRHGKAQISKHGKGLGGMVDLLPDILLDSLWSPRVLNSHLLYHELPSEIQKMKTKIVLTVRNPKDTVVSFYNHNCALSELYNYYGAFNDYFELFMEGKLEYGDYFDYTLHWEKIMKTQKTNPILMVPYEELKSDPLKWVMEVAKFLETPISQQFAREVLDACELSKMKKKRGEKKMQSKLLRKGIVGDWKNWLTDAQSEAIDKRWKEKMSGCVYQPKM